MALALYRKYRPATFAEVIGQEHVTEPLRQALLNDRVHHAYLFSGPRGCGKTSSARILARSLNCEKGPTPDPCGECQSCRDLAPSGPGNVDVIEIDAASHGGVDDARDLRERSFFAPAVSRFKVYIIDEAHMVTAAGFNALLKLVEEPPPHLKFIFATTEPDKVLPTIRSRTHHYPFRLVPPAILREHLGRICEREGVAIEPAALSLVVRAGAGSVRDALSVLDQLIAGAGSDGVTYRYAATLLGYTDAALLDAVIDGWAAGDGAAVLRVVNTVIDAGHDPRRFAEDVLQRLRDLIVLDAVPDAVSSGLLDVPDDALDRMRRQAAALGRANLVRAAEIVNTGITEMRGSLAPRLLLELMVARLLLPGSDEASVLARLERLERRTGSLPSAAPAAGSATQADPVRPAPASAVAASAPATPVSPAPPPASAAAAPAASAASPDRSSAAGTTPSTRDASPTDLAAVRRAWDDVLEAVKRRRRVTHSLLVSGPAQPIDVRGSTLVIGFTTEALERQFTIGASNDEVLTDALSEVLGGRWRVETGILGSPSSTRPAPSQPPSAGLEPAEEDGGLSPEPVGESRPRPRGARATRRKADPAAADAGAPTPPEAQEIVDLDAPVVDDADHLELLQRHLGATVIEEDAD
ncbi:MAG: DNA polymerase III subunit gamma and tau [Acidothermus sp.]|nr:DNA polymerase III subunit gamma and tau [Acidothermus sp.]